MLCTICVVKKTINEKKLNLLSVKEKGKFSSAKKKMCRTHEKILREKRKAYQKKFPAESSTIQKLIFSLSNLHIHAHTAYNELWWIINCFHWNRHRLKVSRQEALSLIENKFSGNFKNLRTYLLFGLEFNARKAIYLWLLSIVKIKYWKTAVPS